MTTATGLQYDEDGNIIEPESAQRKKQKQAIRKYKYRNKNFSKFLEPLAKERESKAEEIRERKAELEEKWENAESVDEKMDISKDYQHLYNNTKILLNKSRSNRSDFSVE